MRQLKIGVSTPLSPRRVPAGVLWSPEEGSRPGLLPKLSGPAFVCISAPQGQEEASGLGNNGSFSQRQRLASRDREAGGWPAGGHGL